MYGPASAPGMRTQKISIFKYLFRKKHKPGDQQEIWEPADGEVAEGKDTSQLLAISSEILPPILDLIPRLKGSDQSDQAAAAEQMVALTNNTSSEEDAIIGKCGALEVIAQVLSKGNEEARISAASAVANLVANANANKVAVCAIPEVLPALVNLTTCSTDKGGAIAARAILNLVSNKDAAISVALTPTAIDAIAKLLLTGKREAKEDAARILDKMVSQGKDVCIMIAKVDSVMQAIKAVSRSVNCSGEARLWTVSALQSLSRCSRVRETLMRAQVVEDVCVPLLASETLGEWTEAMQALATMTAANLTGWLETTVLTDHKKHVALLVHVMAMAVTCREHGRYRFRNSHVLQCLWSVAPNDHFKSELVNAKILELSIDMVALAHTQGHRGMNLHMLLEIIWNMLFCEAGKARFKEIEGVKMLEAHSKGPDPLVRRMARGALWQLGIRETLPEIPQSDRGKHVYFSFHKDDEARVKGIAQGLEAKGYNIVMSRLSGEKKKDGKKTSHLCAMAVGIGSAASVVMCISEQYISSPFCRTEAEFVAECESAVVPLLLDECNPAEYMKQSVSLLDCIDARDGSATDLVIMEIVDEIGAAGKAMGGEQSVETVGYSNVTAPTIALTDLRSGPEGMAPTRQPQMPAQGSHGKDGVQNGDRVESPAKPTPNRMPGSNGRSAHDSPWGGYDSSFMRGDEYGESPAIGRSAVWGGPEDEDYGETDGLMGYSMEPTMPFEELDMLINRIVKERTSKLEARVQTLEAETRNLRSEIASLRESGRTVADSDRQPDGEVQTEAAQKTERITNSADESEQDSSKDDVTKSSPQAETALVTEDLVEAPAEADSSERNEEAEEKVDQDPPNGAEE